MRRTTSCAILGASWLAAAAALAQIPDHPILSEVYCDPPGANDAPVGRDPTNLHQEYIELYLPPAAGLAAGLNKDALRLTFYEIEGDEDSGGYGLVNYRIDLPTFDLDPSNGLTTGAVARPASGVVVLGWVDYLGNPPAALAGTASTRVGLVNGGITAATEYVFVALNGAQFGGTTNFPVPAAISHIGMPAEASSGIVQNGSGVYLLVNRDAAGYVALTDDADPAGGNHNPSLSTNTVLRTTCLLDGFGSNDSSRFDVTDQPSGDNNNDNHVNLPPGGAFSLLVCQLAEDERSLVTPGIASGYARRFMNVRKTTEDAIAGNNNPVTDSLNTYRQVRSVGPFYPTPGRVVQTTDAPELSVAGASEQVFAVLAGTSARPGVLCANSGGNYGISIAAQPGASSNPSAATFLSEGVVAGVMGQSIAFAPLGIQAPLSAIAGDAATATVTVSATNTVGGQPAVLSSVQSVTATAQVLKPTTGRSATGAPLQATVFAAVQPIVTGAAANEFAGTSLAGWVAPRLGGAAVDTWGNGAALLNTATNISAPAVVRPMVRDFPDAVAYVNPAGPPGRLNLAQTVLQSAEVQSGAASYAEVFNATNTALRSTRVNFPDTLTFGGAFTPTEPLYFFEPTGRTPTLRSGLFNATTERTFEVALIDTNVRFDGTFEDGATDDVGIVAEVLDVEPGSPVVPGEFVFLSFMGGLQGADLDGLAVLSGQSVVASIVYLDLDNLHDVLGIRSLEQLWLIDAGSATNEIEFIEAFSLNPKDVPPAPCPGDIDGDRTVQLSDLATLLAHFGTPSGASLAQGDLDADADVDLSDLAVLLAHFGSTCP